MSQMSNQEVAGILREIATATEAVSTSGVTGEVLRFIDGMRKRHIKALRQAADVLTAERCKHCGGEREMVALCMKCDVERP